MKVFVGDKSKQDVKSMMPLVAQIKAFEQAIEQLSHDELRGKTSEFKAKIAEARQPLNDQIEDLLKEAEATEDIDQREDIYQQIDGIKDEVYKVTEDVLNNILPEAFAVVKETTKRFVDNTTISVKQLLLIVKFQDLKIMSPSKMIRPIGPIHGMPLVNPSLGIWYITMCN